MTRVLIVGSGLIGTSVALALSGQGLQVHLCDRDERNVRRAVGRGAGSPFVPGEDPADLCVIAVPPHAVAPTLLAVQRRDLALVYTDVASAKQQVIDDATQLGCDLERYVPGHPIAGGERPGPVAARVGMFIGRPWALCPTVDTRLGALEQVVELVALCGGIPTVLDAATHDRVMAQVSHGPHLVAAAMAAQFATADDTVLSLVGTGLLDATRIAGGDVALWTEIVEHNRSGVIDVLRLTARQLREVADDLDASGTDALIDVLARGVVGRERMVHAATTASRGHHGAQVRDSA